MRLKMFNYCITGAMLLLALILLLPVTSWAQLATVLETEIASSALGWIAPRQEQARQRAQQQLPLVREVVEEGPIRRSQRLRELGLNMKDVKHTYMLLDSPLIKAQEDNYAAVRFNHGQHAAASGDCSICHHLRPVADSSAGVSPDNSAGVAPDNGVGVAPETVRCSACHQQAFNPDYPERLGLKAAYHQQCIPCHQHQQKGPQICSECHLARVPDHKQLVKLPPNPDALQVTAECLRCHQQAGEEMLHTVHWLWRGSSTYTRDHTREVRHGKGTTALNNY
jgi:hypothetical protein